MSENRQAGRPVILGVVGDSAAGKTTIVNGIARILGEDRVVALCTDDYHCYDRATREANGISALDPACNHIDIVEQHLRLLRNGQPILKPVYDHATGALKAPEYVAPREYVLVEGLLGYHTRAMRECYDVKVYLEPDEGLRRRWKVQRDCNRRGYRPDQVEAQIAAREGDSATFIRPQRTFADIVVSFSPPLENTEESGAHLNARHTLRPTLPHPDLTPILDAGGRSGLRLELARDTDGKPVDVLEILGSIEDHRAKAMEELLWGLIPEVHHLRETVGEYINESNQRATSHPLALTQLLLTYHLVKAALGHYAV